MMVAGTAVHPCSRSSNTTGAESYLVANALMMTQKSGDVMMVFFTGPGPSMQALSPWMTKTDDLASVSLGKLEMVCRRTGTFTKS